VPSSRGEADFGNRIIRFWPPLVIFLVSLLSMAVLHPRIGIRDVDAYAYVVGAYSLQQGEGFHDLNGKPLNHWPPGYSLLLSLFPDPLAASYVVNLVALGFAVTFLYLLAIRAGWDWQLAFSLGLVFGFGFFRMLAAFAKPDILTYSLFLLGALLYGTSSRRVQILSYGIWTILIPFKLIAAAFAPGGLMVEWLSSGSRQRPRRRALQIAIALVACLVPLALVLVFNRDTVAAWIPASHVLPGLETPRVVVESLLYSVPRGFLASWIGSLKPPERLLPFLVCVAVGGLALLTLRPAPNQGRLRTLGIVILALILLSNLVRASYGSVRLTGYGLLLILVSLRPRGSFRGLWYAYALCTVAVGTLNALTVPAFGANDPRYDRLAEDVSQLALPPGELLTNSFHLLDLHERIPTKPVRGAWSLQSFEPWEIERPQMDQGNLPGSRNRGRPRRPIVDPDAGFLWVTIPPDELGSEMSWRAWRPGPGWCRTGSVPGAVVYRRC
jgi:hypothetical protein